MKKLILVMLAIILMAVTAAFGVSQQTDQVTAIEVRSSTNIERAVEDSPSRSGARVVFRDEHKVLISEAKQHIKAVERRQALVAEKRQEARAEKHAAWHAEQDAQQAREIAASTPAGIKTYAAGLVGAEQFPCLDSLWERESGWDYTAANPTSSAYGIPQALPGIKMASAGADWETNPYTQVDWGVGYIAERYGSACAAWSHSESVGWY